MPLLLPVSMLVLRLDLEVLEGLLRDQVVGLGLVGHRAVDDRPARGAVGHLQVPGVERLAVEQLDRLAVGVRRVGVRRRPRRRMRAGERDRPVARRRRAFEPGALALGAEGLAGAALGRRGREDQLVALDLDRRRA